ncbi:MAG: hypothetical protein OHK0052_03940 [Anaerolineales bacterium]
MEISQDLASTLDLSVLLNRIVLAAAELSDSEAASILLYDEGKKQLYFQAATNMDEPLMNGLMVPLDSLAGWIVLNRQPIIIGDARRDARHFAKIEESTNFETRSLLGVPLITKNKVIGALEALNKRQGEFTQDDLNILGALGAQAAVAIENTRLFQQSDLISEFVHELRTPLASLNTAAHLLMHPALTQDRREQMIQNIYGETSRLSSMASDFLDIARLESGRVQFLIENVEIAPLLESCVHIMQGKADEKQQTLILDITHEIPAFKGDRNKIKQVALNLLSNAIKYTPEGGTIWVMGGLSQDGMSATITVRDTGRGIPAEGLRNLFQKFYRVPGSEKMASGTGLGLSICKKIVEGHGGHINVSSQVGKGTTFQVEIPLRRFA